MLHGLIDIGGNDFGSPAGANLEVTAGYAMPVGAKHTIIVYDPGDLIDQRFRDPFGGGDTLDEGDFFTSGGSPNLLNISYYTESHSNNVTLTHPGRYDFNASPEFTQGTYGPVSPGTWDGQHGRVAGARCQSFFGFGVSEGGTLTGDAMTPVSLFRDVHLRRRGRRRRSRCRWSPARPPGATR